MKEFLQQVLAEAKADAIEVFTYQDGISAASKDAIEYMHSWLTVYFDKQALAQQEQPAQEACWCDQNNIGEPGVSCGDCPTRDYKQPALSDDEILKYFDSENGLEKCCMCHLDDFIKVYRAIEAHCRGGAK